MVDMSGNLSEILGSAFAGGALGGAFGGLLIASLAVIIILVLAVYIYTALAWMTIGKKLKYKYPWLAWIPIANGAMILQMGGFHWAWIFLMLIPWVGGLVLMVFAIIATWRIFEKRNYPGWLSLVPILALIPLIGLLAGLAYLIILGFVAWKDMKK